MSLKIRYLKSRPVGKVTFSLPGEAAPGAATVHIVGEFNDWDKSATPMQRLQNGTFKATLDLETGRSYRYRYLIDNEKWENDWDAHRYETAMSGAVENSVVDV